MQSRGRAPKSSERNPWKLVALSCSAVVVLLVVSLLRSENAPAMPGVPVVSTTLWGKQKFDTVPRECVDVAKTQKAFEENYNKEYGWTPGSTLQERGPQFYYSKGDLEKERSSLSGSGSFTGYATNNSLHFLVNTIKEYNIKTVLDIPCGDVNWQMQAWETDSLELYVGADVVADVIIMDMERFKHHKNKLFKVWDFTTCPLPQLHDAESGVTRNFDLVHVRDVLMHLSFEDATKASKHILTSGIPYLIATTYPEAENVNITSGGWYEANLSKPPFNFPEPHYCEETHPLMEADLTCLYKLGQR